MSISEAIRHIRKDPECADLVRDAYLGEDIQEAADRFLSSAEFIEVQQMVRPLQGKSVLDLGAGNGIASHALAMSGAGVVVAVDPDPGSEVGIGALRTIADGLPIAAVVGFGERLPLQDDSIDLVYVRQVLHHALDLPGLLSECARVLKHGGTLLACREHVVDDERQLAVFLENHPVNRLTHTENAHSLPEYLEAFRRSGLNVERILRPWDSIINAYPAVRSIDELIQTPQAFLKRHLGPIGSLISHLPGSRSLVFAWLNRALPGRLYSFVATKP